MSFDRNQLPDPVSYYEGEGLRLQGRGIWRTTNCEFHEGRSMRINIKTGGYVCMNCGEKGGDVLAYHMAKTGADFVQAAKCLGAWVYDGKGESARPTPLPPRAALQVLGFESCLVAVAAGNVAHGRQLTDRDRERVMVAAGRINRLAEAFK